MTVGMDDARGIGWGNRALALGLTVVLGALWLRSGWYELGAGILPDSDDMVRMAQVRDWLGGQRFTDISQHRLGLGGSGTLHWSRLGDIGIAAWIVALRPLLGEARAELWAAILYPIGLFALMLAASGRIALRIGGQSQASIAILLAAFAFPAIMMFFPGRIDHHGLQIVLTLVLVEALLARRGAVAGLSTAAMLAIGLETAPLVFVAMAVLAIDFARDPEARTAVGRFGGTLGAATLAWLAVARPEVWPNEWCDGFTPASTRATLVASAWFVLVALAPVRLRLAIGAMLAVAALALGWLGSSVCATGPYGPVDPLLARLWLANVVEARPLFHDGLGNAVAFGGLASVGLAAAATMAWRTRDRRWLILLSFQGAAIAIALLQLRGATMAAALATPALATMIAAARARGQPLLLVGAWLISAGLLWSVAGRLLDTRAAPATRVTGASCTAPETLAQLAQAPPGLVIAPIDVGAYLIGATRHRVLAAPYHRNNAGNLAAYRFWLSTPDAAHAQAAALNADYVLACGNAFGGIALDPASMAARIGRGDVPDWLAPLPLRNSAGRLYRVLR